MCISNQSSSDTDVHLVTDRWCASEVRIWSARKRSSSGSSLISDVHPRCACDGLEDANPLPVTTGVCNSVSKNWLNTIVKIKSLKNMYVTCCMLIRNMRIHLLLITCSDAHLTMKCHVSHTCLQCKLWFFPVLNTNCDCVEYKLWFSPQFVLNREQTQFVLKHLFTPIPLSALITLLLPALASLLRQNSLATL